MWPMSAMSSFQAGSVPKTCASLRAAATLGRMVTLGSTPELQGDWAGCWAKSGTAARCGKHALPPEVCMDSERLRCTGVGSHTALGFLYSPMTSEPR